MTSYGERCVRSLVYDVAAAGVTIVSGFMYGIDAAAHRAALDSGGKTIAVMPCGIDLITPEYQTKLYEEILSAGGLVLSEFEKDFPPSPWTFPKRNRIVAGLCSAVLVVEAGLGSGSLITAEYAKKFGREVFAIPGNIDSKLSAGTLLLIEGGVRMVTSPRKILEFYGVGSIKEDHGDLARGDGQGEGVGAGAANVLLALLALEPLTLDEIAEKTRENVSSLGSQLTLLEMRGQVSSLNGKYYVEES